MAVEAELVVAGRRGSGEKSSPCRQSCLLHNGSSFFYFLFLTAIPKHFITDSNIYIYFSPFCTKKENNNNIMT